MAQVQQDLSGGPRCLVQNLYRAQRLACQVFRTHRQDTCLPALSSVPWDTPCHRWSEEGLPPHLDLQLGLQLGHDQHGAPAQRLLAAQDVPVDVVPHVQHLRRGAQRCRPSARSARRLQGHVRGDPSMPSALSGGTRVTGARGSGRPRSRPCHSLVALHGKLGGDREAHPGAGGSATG